MLSLRVERVKRNWTQEELSAKSGVSRVTISNIERRGIKNIPVYTLEKLAKSLDTTVAKLFFSEEE
ncbi:helix-turn-helix transcriptional regulator [Clostridium paraputrificum]|uniref:helix-turn-helix domain-containing protein n=1 Tax=Clostridium paraputrificum TaxID=29363 RepID=UPI00232E1C59|nr:helix-turn-helix transcriptional regulator [Clostridium paraputrificum]MDB2073335.1 helix-turn-helix transcriptional regulator [Clostridium paraputrificum]MDB2083774.1 helix-turn-helix transcriptional regulator [Clostridium paraputrificum]